MSHDLEEPGFQAQKITNLLNLIKELEVRINKLERLRDEKINQGDTWYWEHG